MSQSENNEQRQFTRIPFENTVRVRNRDKTWETRLLDISLNGALIEQPRAWQANIGDVFELEIDLQHSGVEIRMEVTIAHMENGHVGCQCQHIDLDSITHLRRLVELNVGNTDILNRELSALGSH
jgi:hypothetical protein